MHRVAPLPASGGMLLRLNCLPCFADARIEVWFLGSYPGYSSEKNVAVMPNGRSFAREEMETVWKTKYIDVSFELSQKLQKLKVTPEEIIIVKTICLTAGGTVVVVFTARVCFM